LSGSLGVGRRRGVGLCLAAERKSERAGERARLVVHGLGWSGLVWSGMGVK